MTEGIGGPTAFVLAGGGTKGSFEVGALQYLVGMERITPDIVTATSAGAIAATVLAQARTLAEFAQRVQEIEDDIVAMTRPEHVFGEQAWLRALEGTALGARSSSPSPRGRPLPPTSNEAVPPGTGSTYRSVARRAAGPSAEPPANSGASAIAACSAWPPGRAPSAPGPPAGSGPAGVPC